MYVPSDLVIQILECHPADKLQQLTFKGLQMYSWLLCMRQGGKNLNFQGLENSLNKSWPIGLAGKETHRPNERARSGREFHATGAGGGEETQKQSTWGLPGGPVVKTLSFQAWV